LGGSWDDCIGHFDGLLRLDGLLRPLIDSTLSQMRTKRWPTASQRARKLHSLDELASFVTPRNNLPISV
jgi:hypothetical protein